MLPREPVAFSGSPGSPYTRKMLAVMRYRRIPYRLLMGAGAGAGLPQPKVRLLPTFYLPGEDGLLEAVTDSTPLIRRLDLAVTDRQVAPADPGLNLIDAVIEDFGDEWLTKAMFHYRWSYPADVAKSAHVLPNWMGKPLDDEALASLGAAFSERQIGRLRYVGSNPVTGPVIEDSYRRTLGLLEEHFRHHPFLLGERPGAGDFGVFGQLTQLVRFDPTPMAIATEAAPRVCAWVETVEDLSGLEPAPADWIDLSRPPTTMLALLREIGRVYAPLLLANADALAAGASVVETLIDGRAWSQAPFPYQAKCLRSLQNAYAALDAEAKGRVDGVLAGTGVDLLFTSTSSAGS